MSKRNDLWRSGLTYTLLIAMAVISLLPFFWMLTSSLKSQSEIFRFPPVWIPADPQWDNYVRAWNAGGLNFGLMFINSLKVVVPVTIFTIISASLAAYAFARIQFVGRDVWFGLFLASMMIPTAPTIIPRFILFRELQWLDTLLPLIVPGLFGSAFAMFLLRQFFLTLPGELEDAMMIDGASRLRIWWQLFLPLSKPIIATLVVFTAQAEYNDFLNPLIYINSADNFTVQLGLASFRGIYQTRYDLLMAASVFTLLPIVVLFLSAQRYFVSSINLSGLKA
jgi:multiple sugar transport system permease protein